VDDEGCGGVDSDKSSSPPQCTPSEGVDGSVDQSHNRVFFKKDPAVASTFVSATVFKRAGTAAAPNAPTTPFIIEFFFSSGASSLR